MVPFLDLDLDFLHELLEIQKIATRNVSNLVKCVGVFLTRTGVQRLFDPVSKASYLSSSKKVLPGMKSVLVSHALRTQQHT